MLLFDRWGVLAMLTSSKWKHPKWLIPIFIGLGVALPSLAQNSHDLLLVHSAFALGYVFLIVGLLYWLNAILSAEGRTSKTKLQRSLLLIAIFAAAIVLLALFHRDKIISLRRERAVPWFTIKVANSAFPVSVPSHSTLLILPLHPYWVFTDTNSHLHEYENDCAEARNWPSQDEINSKPANGFEEVRRIEVTNHSQNAMESGRVVFDILYGESFAGGCSTPPVSSTPQQHDVVSIPALDPGKSFEFIAVNQSARCAWLLAPKQIRVTMANDENAMDVPLKFEPGVVSTLRLPRSARQQSSGTASR